MKAFLSDWTSGTPLNRTDNLAGSQTGYQIENNITGIRKKNDHFEMVEKQRDKYQRQHGTPREPETTIVVTGIQLGNDPCEHWV